MEFAYEEEAGIGSVSEIHNMYQENFCQHTCSSEFLSRIREEHMLSELAEWLVGGLEKPLSSASDGAIPPKRSIHCPELERIELSGCFLTRDELILMAHALRVREALAYRFENGMNTWLNIDSEKQDAAEEAKPLTLTLQHCHVYREDDSFQRASGCARSWVS